MMTNNIELNENNIYSQKNIKDKVLDIVGKYDNSITEVDDEDVLLEIEIEDLSKIQITMEIERLFNVEFELTDIENINKVKDLVSFIEAYNR